MIPDSDHNEALTGDTLYSVFLNHEWREIVVAAVLRYMVELAADIEDETDLQEFEVRYGALIDDFYNEESMDGTPVGAVIAWLGEIADIPVKYLHCDGATHLGADYPELFAALADIFKTATHFNTPDMEDRFLLGSGINDDVGGLGGANQHTLVEAEMPAHLHQVPAHSHTFASFNNAGSGGANVVASGSSGGASTKTSSTQAATNTDSKGSGSAHNNMPAYIAVHWIIKALP
jgi:microcystin-dependent protein